MTFMFNEAKDLLLTEQINWETDDIRVIGVTNDYDADETDTFLSAVNVGYRVGDPETLDSRTIADGVLDGEDIIFEDLTGAPIQALLIYRHTGVDATSHMLIYYDSSPDLPYTPRGASVWFRWPEGPNKIMALL